jgi:hypothetical protein
LGIDFAKEMAHNSSPNLVPKKKFLRELLEGWRKKH